MVAHVTVEAKATEDLVKINTEVKPLLSTFPIVQALIDYQRLNRCRFHIPGHSGKELSFIPGFSKEVYAYDLTEVEGLDVLSEPEDCILQSQQRAAQLFGVRESFYLVNGSSLGLQAALFSSLKPGDKVLLPRNVHRSVISGLILTGAEPVWILPEWLSEWGLWGSVALKSVEESFIKNPSIKALLITSPTYEGIASDVQALSALCRAHDVLLLIDEAHGSLWPFSSELPLSACHFPCDFVVHSLHKSAGSLTQTAIAHLPHGSLIDPEKFQHALNTLQTTSPSYLLLASIDATCAFLASPEVSQPYIQTLLQEVKWLREKIHQEIQGFQLYEHDQPHLWDPTQVYLKSLYEAGEEWAYRLEKLHRVAFEKTDVFGTLYKASLGLQHSDYQQLFEALSQEDRQYKANSLNSLNCYHFPKDAVTPLPQTERTPRDAFFAPGEKVSRTQSLDRVAKETYVHCPPGIPLLIPGEIVQEGHLPYLPEFVNVIQ